VALVTGAARRVGRAIALALAAEGVDVVLHYGRSADDAARTADEIRAAGVDVLPVSADLADAAAIERLFEATRERFGRLDVLVNSAAMFRKRAFESVSLADWDEVMGVNLRAPFLCTQHAARLMRASSRPAGDSALVVNIADLSGVQVWRGYAVHGISKAGVLHLTSVAALELAPAVRVNAIVPGPILPAVGVDPTGAVWARIVDSLPLARAGDPSDIARAVVFLARSDFITGIALPVDGGQHLVGAVDR
jgi:pteridine reductase